MDLFLREMMSSRLYQLGRIERSTAMQEHRTQNPTALHSLAGADSVLRGLRALLVSLRPRLLFSLAFWHGLKADYVDHPWLQVNFTS